MSYTISCANFLLQVRLLEAGKEHTVSELSKLQVPLTCNTGYIPYTIHHTPYTIHPTPYAMHHTPYTIHHASYTIHLTYGLLQLIHEEGSTILRRDLNKVLITADADSTLINHC
jgi:hypothetical protein